MMQLLKQNHIIAEEDAEIYQYGFEILISNILSFFITLLIGMLLQAVWLSLLYYGIFVLMRQLTGGYHADTYLKCNLTFSAVTLFTIGMGKIMYISNAYIFLVQILLLSIPILVIWKDAPIENVNKPLTESQKKRNHKASLILLFFLVVTSCILYYFGKMQAAILITLTLFSISMLIVIEKIRKENTSNEESAEVLIDEIGFHQ